MEIPVSSILAVWLFSAGCGIHAAIGPPAAKERANMASEVQHPTSPFPEEGRAKYYVVGIGREISINGKLAIKFVKVTEDSRCPKEAVCVWSGRVSLDTLVTTGGKPKRIVFKVMGINRWPPTGEIKSSTFKTLEVDGNEITLMDLAPYPVYRQSTDPKDYKALFYLGANPPSFDTGPPSRSLD